MVHALARFPGHVKDRDSLMRDAKIVVDDSTITSHIKRIRRKFLAVDPQFDRIATVYGMGYRWNPRHKPHSRRSTMNRPRIALGIRAQLLLVLTVFLALPWLGYEYVRELERFLRDAQERTLAGTAQAVATALHDRPRLFEPPRGTAANRSATDARRRGRGASRRALPRRRRRRSSRSSRACRARRRASGSSIASSTCSRARAASGVRAAAGDVPPRRRTRRAARAMARARGPATPVRARASAAHRGLQRRALRARGCRGQATSKARLPAS